MNRSESGRPTEPIAKRYDYVHNDSGVLRADPYFWLNNRDDPQVIKYLEEENEYTKLILEKTQNLQADLFEEIKNRIKQDDTSCPIPWKDFVYYTRFEQGSEYAKFYRRGKNELINNEELLFDVPAMSVGYDFFDFDQTFFM